MALSRGSENLKPTGLVFFQKKSGLAGEVRLGDGRQQLSGMGRGEPTMADEPETCVITFPARLRPQHQGDRVAGITLAEKNRECVEGDRCNVRLSQEKFGGFSQLAPICRTEAGDDGLLGGYGRFT